ncbi:hypothetical protein ACHAW5_007679 [Stephanodiscus triporus]|uniref:Uncharacterized protein n=1 Tax=Stephanodiscus triporus TaxID=2934178 RepID=A0ABD3NM22_9STRA
MSLMTESLLLRAQSLRAEGEADESIDVLRVVISQCTSDIDASSSSSSISSSPDHRRHPPAGGRDGSEVARRMRDSSCLALATMLLQRAGRRGGETKTTRRGRASVHDDENDDGRDDENEADAILDGLGYRTRLSTMAFGYPSCSSCCRPPRPPRADVVVARERSSSPPPPPPTPPRVVGFRRTVVVDDAMPASMFGALRRALRTGSRYWSEFHCRGGNGDSTTNDREGDGAMRRRRRRRNSTDDDGRFFASHNIPLPASGGGAASRSSSSSSSSLADHLRRSKSLLEQAAVLARSRLLRPFPEVIDATSVEVWCHRRPRDDGGHRLHYDTDEILLWERRREEAGRRSDGREGEGEGEIRGDGTTTTIGDDATTKTAKIGDDAAVDAGGRSRKRLRTGPSSSGPSFGYDDGISCPIVSCVLTICVPDDACRSCGGAANGAPTIVCDQSILSPRRGNDNDGTRRKNVGYLCFPRPNRLLAFDGSLLHGVVPGMPLARPRKPAEPSSDDDEGSRSSDHSYDDDVDDDKDGGSDSAEGGHRITLMMGFWRDVRTTTTATETGDDASSSFSTTAGLRPIGPNVPYVPQDGTWTDEFVSTSVSGSDLADIDTMSATTDESSDLAVVNPLWIPIVSVVNANEDKKYFGKYSRRDGDKEIQPTVRFFLKSLDPRNIDDEVLSGT